MRLRYLFVLFLILAIVAICWGGLQAREKNIAQNKLQNTYQSAFCKANTHIQNIEALLSKILVGQEGSQDNYFLTNLFLEARMAQDNFAQIPIPVGSIDKTMLYLNQLSDYVQVLNEKIASGGSKTEEQWKNLQSLYEQAKNLNSEIKGMEEKISQGEFNWVKLELNSFEDLNYKGKESIGQNLVQMEDKMKQFPALIYDGPFSDHLKNKEAVGLKGEEIDEKKAQEIALELMKIEENKNYEVNKTIFLEAYVPTYQINIKEKDKDSKEDISLGIAKKGGEILWLIWERPLNKKAISLKEAKEKAENYLKEFSFLNMESTYYEEVDNLVTFNFVAKQEEIILYADLVKISIALDNGKIWALEANNYWDSHQKRDLNVPRYSLEDTKENLSPRLDNLSEGRLTLIPISPEQEVLTYEFEGNLGEDKFLIYLNAQNGQEEKILRLINTSKGVLTL